MEIEKDRRVMNKNSITYRFSRGYLIGFAIAGTLYILPMVSSVAQVVLGISMGIVSWTWLKGLGENTDG